MTSVSRTFDEPADPGTALDGEQVVAVHGDYVWASLERLGVAASDRADALQDVLIVVHRRRNDFDARLRITAWLYGICVRVAIARRRRAHVRREHVVAQLPTDADIARGPDPDRPYALCTDARRLIVPGTYASTALGRIEHRPIHCDGDVFDPLTDGCQAFAVSVDAAMAATVRVTIPSRTA